MNRIEINAALFNEAIIYAAKKHRGQVRKGDGRPYILHPMDVVHVLYEVKESKNLFLLGIAAILHDVVEDCGVKMEKIAKKFGFAVASLVEELTLQKENYALIGKTKYLCNEILGMTSYALCIKLCDRLCNVRDMKDMSKDFIAKYVPETREIIKAARSRKVTKTHEKLIQLIELELDKY